MEDDKLNAQHRSTTGGSDRWKKERKEKKKIQAKVTFEKAIKGFRFAREPMWSAIVKRWLRVCAMICSFIRRGGNIVCISLHPFLQLKSTFCRIMRIMVLYWLYWCRVLS